MNKTTPNTGRKYSQLSQAEREEIAILLSLGIGIYKIAEALGRHPSTIYREIERNTPVIRKVKYRAHIAQKYSEQRKKAAHMRQRLNNKKVRNYIIKKLKAYWSPQIIAAKLSEDNPGLKTNHESIYQWIYSE
ncbi:helix-turn-helix domain-containing protein [Treponema sp. OttesenSCG-928-L16]|nr:helix-turn-helix domain-containing protein [Treponema sp. OttesenSCG-928-L16]